MRTLSGEDDIDDLILECGAPEGSDLGSAFSKAGDQGPKMWLWWDPEATTLEYDDEKGTQFSGMDIDDEGHGLEE
ncbi:hypothetical protein BJ166DRAFT_591124 [Pestalotiopsis sp. NC0098]|nr:hypothetical protein BJ166DRAFT_591124 [Pestalotiopsis sp. NC0098]